MMEARSSSLDFFFFLKAILMFLLVTPEVTSENWMTGRLVPGACQQATNPTEDAPSFRAVVRCWGFSLLTLAFLSRCM